MIILPCFYILYFRTTFPLYNLCILHYNRSRPHVYLISLLTLYLLLYHFYPYHPFIHYRTTPSFPLSMYVYYITLCDVYGLSPSLCYKYYIYQKLQPPLCLTVICYVLSILRCSGYNFTLYMLSTSGVRNYICGST